MGRQADFFDALAEPLRERIRAGELRPGDFLPSETALARASSTKRYSIRKALTLLRDEDLIEAVPGSGWAVRDPGATPESAAPGPRYRQIAHELRSGIEVERFPAGSYLPSEAELMSEFTVSRATVRQALGILEREGLITAQPGKGRYVHAR